MLSVVSVLTSLLLASVGTTAAAVQARAGICHPDVAGKQLNIVNGQFQLGYPAGAYFPNVLVEAEALTIPLAPVFKVDPSGNGLLTSEFSIPSHECTLNVSIFNKLREPSVELSSVPHHQRRLDPSSAPAPHHHLSGEHVSAPEQTSLKVQRADDIKSTQAWFFTCDACNSDIAYGCEVQSAGTGQCAQIGTAVGQTTGVVSCTGLDYGSQIFTLHIS
ncbi:hypothetical protein C8R45DRAFT_923316 [Mycena sanguinolenta]|nr:hypothetical protein C8R45DRAFT_923316 [Mycena sanguinolenta]